MSFLRRHRISHRGRVSQRAFTLIELLVVIAVLALLLLMLIPTQAGSRTKSQGIRCLDNMRQIMNAMMLYTRDNHDFFPPNPDDGNTVTGHNWCPGVAGPGQNAEFNSDLIASRCLLMPYVNTNVSLLRCTADLRIGNYQGTDPTKFGTKVPAARSISMNFAVGTICPGFNSGTGHSGRPTLSCNGPWLNNAHSHLRNTPWRTYGRLSEVVIPGPANLWVMTEEAPASINDGGFSFGMNVPEWIDFPSTLHGMSCVVGFADGHADLHKWVDRRTVPPTPIARVSVSGSGDWMWMRDRTSARAQ